MSANSITYLRHEFDLRKSHIWFEYLISTLTFKKKHGMILFARIKSLSSIDFLTMALSELRDKGCGKFCLQTIYVLCRKIVAAEQPETVLLMIFILKANRRVSCERISFLYFLVSYRLILTIFDYPTSECTSILVHLFIAKRIARFIIMLLFVCTCCSSSSYLATGSGML